MSTFTNDKDITEMSRQELHELNIVSTKHLTKRELNEFKRKERNSSKPFENPGIKFGYPPCCINYFHSNNYYKPNYNRLHNTAGLTESGFSPCLLHMKQLAKGEITIEELLKTRKCRYAFPCQGRECNDAGVLFERVAGDKTWVEYYDNYPKYYIHKI